MLKYKKLSVFFTYVSLLLFFCGCACLKPTRLSHLKQYQSPSIAHQVKKIKPVKTPISVKAAQPLVTSLEDAVIVEEMTSARILLDQGADINAFNTKWQTPLHFARTVKMADFLIARGAKINVTDKNGGSPILNAALRGNEKLVDFLIAKGAEINLGTNFRGDKGWTSLHIAAWRGRVDAIELLLKKGADISAKRSDGRTALHIAATMRNLNVAETLIKHGAEVDAADRMGQTPSYSAAWQGHLEMLELLVKHGADLKIKTKSQDTLMHTISVNSKRELVEWLIGLGLDVNAANKYGDTPLHVAAEKKNAEVAAALIEGGADINARKSNGNTPLDIALRSGRLEKSRKVVALLIERGAEVSLHVPVSVNDVEGVRTFLQQGVDVNVRNSRGLTPLHVASEKGYLEVARLLIESGALVDIRSEKALMTPLHLAAVRGHTEVVELLIKNGADIDPKDKWQKTPLNFAASKKHRKIYELLIARGAGYGIFDVVFISDLKRAKALLDAGADVNAKNRDEEIPLHIAVLRKDKDIVKLLLKRGALVNTLSSKRESPLDKAAFYDRVEMVEILIDNGAKYLLGSLGTAVKMGRKKTVLLLLTRGALDGATEINKQYLLDLATKRGHKDIFEIIRKYNTQQ